MAEQLRARSCNPEVPSSSPLLACYTDPVIIAFWSTFLPVGVFIMVSDGRPTKFVNMQDPVKESIISERGQIMIKTELQKYHRINTDLNYSSVHDSEIQVYSKNYSVHVIMTGSLLWFTANYILYICELKKDVDGLCRK